MQQIGHSIIAVTLVAIALGLALAQSFRWQLRMHAAGKKRARSLAIRLIGAATTIFILGLCLIIARDNQVMSRNLFLLLAYGTCGVVLVTYRVGRKSWT